MVRARLCRDTASQGTTTITSTRTTRLSFYAPNQSMFGLKCIRRAILFLTLLVLSTRVAEFVLVNYLPRFFVFDNAHLQSIVQDSINSLSIDASADQVMASVHAKLKESYPEYINEMRSEDWVFNNAGNAMGTMIILHASFTEYLIFFGTSIGTDGHTGTHFSNDYFTILTGEQLAAFPNETKPERYLPGDQHWLQYGQQKHYAMPKGSFALELAQGYIPSMLPFGFIEVLTSTFDVYNFGKTVKLTAQDMISNLLKGKF